MEKNSWLDKVVDEGAVGIMNEDKQILNCVWKKKHRRIGHVLRQDGLLHEIIEGRMRVKPTRRRRKFQMVHGLANNDGCVALK